MPFSLSCTLSHYQVQSPTRPLLLVKIMFKPSTNSVAPEEWHYYRRWDRKLWKLEKTLLSQNRTYTEKAWIIHMIPLDTAKKYTKVRQTEYKLEDARHTCLTQLIRWKWYGALAADVQKQHRQRAQRAVVIDIEARWIVQREAYLQEEA